MNKGVGIGIAVAIVVVVGIAVFSITVVDMTEIEPSTINEDNTNSDSYKSNTKIETTSNSPYTYNTICDLGTTPEDVMSNSIPIAFEIISGNHNDNKILIEFFKTNEVLSKSQLTPDQVFDSHEGTNALRPNYDPLFYDSMFWLPVGLEIMNTNPEIIDTLTMKENESEDIFSDRIHNAIIKCQ